MARRNTGPWWRTTSDRKARSARPSENTGLTGSPTGGSWAGSPTNTSRVRKGWAQRRLISSRLLSTIEASSISTRPRCSRAMAVCSVSSQRSRSRSRRSLSRSSRWIVAGNQVGCRPCRANRWRNTPTALWVGATTVQQRPEASTWASRCIERKVLPVPAKPLNTKGLPSLGALSQVEKAASACCWPAVSGASLEPGKGRLTRSAAGPAADRNAGPAAGGIPAAPGRAGPRPGRSRCPQTPPGGCGPGFL